MSRRGFARYATSTKHITGSRAEQSSVPHSSVAGVLAPPVGPRPRAGAVRHRRARRALRAVGWTSSTASSFTMCNAASNSYSAVRSHAVRPHPHRAQGSRESRRRSFEILPPERGAARGAVRPAQPIPMRVVPLHRLAPRPRTPRRWGSRTSCRRSFALESGHHLEPRWPSRRPCRHDHDRPTGIDCLVGTSISTDPVQRLGAGFELVGPTRSPCLPTESASLRRPRRSRSPRRDHPQRALTVGAFDAR